MKRILLLTTLLFTGFTFGQIIEQYNFTGALNANGWTSHSGIAAQFQADNAGSLTYPGLPVSVGNKANYVSGNTEDVNKALSIATDSAYYSMILNLPNTTGLAANTSLTGDNFFGFGQSAGASVTTFGGQLRIRTGTVANTFQIAVLNVGAAALTPTFSGDYPTGTPIFVVVKVKRATSPVQAKLWINPTLGLTTEPTAMLTSTLGTGTFSNFASLYMRQGTSTGNVQIDEIRAGDTWAGVTPSGCSSSSSLTITHCGPYTLNASTYSTSGNYSQTLVGANINGCDSVINLALTIHNPSTANLTVSNCGPYTLNGTTYPTTGIYTQTLTNGNMYGCDSVINLDLSVVASITYYADTDNDGLGNANATVAACSLPVGYVTNSTDCDDTNAAIGAATIWYMDMDMDGYGNSAMTTTACVAPIGYVGNSTDCDDANAAIHPGATEIANNGIDEDCSGADLVILPAQLAQYTFTGNDCTAPVLSVTAQPANATFSDYEAQGGLTCTTAANVLNNSGWNTSGAINPAQYYGFTITPDSCYALNLYNLKWSHRVSSGAPTVTVRSSLDNFQSDIYSAQITTPATYVNVTLPLPVAFQTIYGPIEFRFYITTMGSTGATYRHDNVSVEGFITALSSQTYYADVDGDGFGDPTVAVTNCVPPAGYVADNTDCDDNDSLAFPGAMWYADTDLDGLGDPLTSMMSCTQPAGYIADHTDCDDTNPAIAGNQTFYQDNDADGFGNFNVTITACSAPVGYVTNDLDCDDTNPTIGGAALIFYADADNDSFGDASNSTVACSAPAGYVADNTDCDDTNPATYPGASEVCDGLDNNCDGTADEGLTTFTWYQDADGDGKGNLAVTTQNCQQPVGYVGNSSDCDDTDPTPNAGATLYYADADNDTFGDAFNGILACTAPAGYVANDLDCNDTDAAINPNAVDTEGNAIDENCDGVDGNLGVAAFELQGVVVAPNPGNELVTVNGVSLTTTLEVVAVDGKVVAVPVAHTANTTMIVTTESLVPGMYLMTLRQGNQTKTIRWIKK
jgi:hypothetical protein